MVAIIIICIVVFLIVVLLFNYQKIVEAIKKKRQSKDSAQEKPAKKSDNGVIMGEDLVQKKVDDLKKEPAEKVEGEPFVVASEDELKELESKSKRSGGRRSGDIKTISNIDVNVEELDDDDEIEQQTDTQKNTIAQQIKSLPPEIKALILSDLFDKKDE